MAISLLAVVGLARPIFRGTLRMSLRATYPLSVAKLCVVGFPERTFACCFAGLSPELGICPRVAHLPTTVAAASDVERFELRMPITGTDRPGGRKPWRLLSHRETNSIRTTKD